MLGRFLSQFAGRFSRKAERGAEERLRDVAQLVNASVVQKNLGRITEARALLERAVAAEPQLPHAWYNLGILLHELQCYDEAQEAFEQALQSPQAAFEPGLLSSIVFSSALTLQLSGEWLRVRRFLEEMAARHSWLAKDCLRLSLFTWVVAPDARPEPSRAVHEDWARRFLQAPAAAKPHENDPDPDRTLRIGYVSGDLCAHAVSHFFEPVLKHHDTHAWDVYCYNNSARSDEVTRRLMRWPATWVDASALDDAALFKRIRSDGIDILIDLSGHTARNRLDVFARRPAPVQVTWLGYRTTTGMAAMQYRITDAVADPPGVSEAWYVERMIRLPYSQWCFAEPAVEIDPGPAPASVNGYVTFGSFNQFDKIHEAVISAWASILHAVPRSRLLLARVPGGRRREAFLALWQRHGIPAERLQLHGYVSREDFQALHRCADIALDTFPCNGGATTCESLWMGLPVLSVAGDWGVSRAAMSLLAAAGLSDWIARDEEHYIKLAVEKAADLSSLMSLRQALRSKLHASPLMDGAGFTRALESGLRGAWREWCDTAPGATGA